MREKIGSSTELLQRLNETPGSGRFHFPAKDQRFHAFDISSSQHVHRLWQYYEQRPRGPFLTAATILGDVPPQKLARKSRRLPSATAILHGSPLLPSTNRLESPYPVQDPADERGGTSRASKSASDPQLSSETSASPVAQIPREKNLDPSSLLDIFEAELAGSARPQVSEASVERGKLQTRSTNAPEAPLETPYHNSSTLDDRIEAAVKAFEAFLKGTIDSLRAGDQGPAERTAILDKTAQALQRFTSRIGTQPSHNLSGGESFFNLFNEASANSRQTVAEPTVLDRSVSQRPANWEPVSPEAASESAPEEPGEPDAWSGNEPLLLVDHAATHASGPIHRCADLLMEMGYRYTDRSRLIVYAEMAGGDVETAIDIIEEDEQAVGERHEIMNM